MQVEIWSDVVCPWCYLGKRHFERALEQFVANLRRFVKGEPLVNVVDKRAGY